MSHQSRICRAIAFLVLLAGLAPPSHAVTIHVPEQQPAIQAGIDASAYGDTVLVACGTYYEHDIIMKSGICLMSETGQPGCVTIDAQERYTACIMECIGVDASTSITGFTITGAWHSNGGGMKCLQGASPKLTNVLFSRNISDHGGALYCSDSSPVLENVTFRDNWAYLSGGGMYCWQTSPSLETCDFASNGASDHGGAMVCNSASASLST